MDVERFAWLFLAFLVAYLLALLVRERWKDWTALWRMRQGREAEAVARALLIEKGYAIEAEQPRCRGLVACGGVTIAYELRADFKVRRDERTFMADCKTGASASVRSIATRRQLLEYSIVFACDGVLLVNPWAGTVEEVTFPKELRT